MKDFTAVLAMNRTRVMTVSAHRPDNHIEPSWEVEKEIARASGKELRPN
jgi:hypothetical protein